MASSSLIHVCMNNNSLPDDLLDLPDLDWQPMDSSEIINDNVPTVVSEPNNNMMSQSFESYLNPCPVPDVSYTNLVYPSNDTTDWSHSPTEMIQQSCMEGMEYPEYPLDNAPYAFYSQSRAPNSLGDSNSSPDSSLNDSYRTDTNMNITTLQPVWQQEEQHSDDSVELELTPQLDDSPRNEFPFHCYRMQQADVLPHFDKVFPPKHQKISKRGRPVTFLRRKGSSRDNHVYYYSDSSDEDDRIQSKCKRGAKNVLLWKFLLEQLDKPNGAYIQWVDALEGSFRFVDTAEISKQWGNMKNKTDMNFEKLSRGIRHYYKAGLMARQDGTRLVYRFNWDLVPRENIPEAVKSKLDHLEAYI